VVIVGAVALGTVVTPPIVGALGLEAAIVVLAVAPALVGVAVHPALRQLDRASAARTALLGRRVEVLEASGLFAAAPRPVLERLAAESSEIAVQAGEPLVTEGDRADALYVIKTGAVDVRSGWRWVAALGAGDWFGELGLLEGVPRTATVTASEPCTLLRIDGDAFVDSLSAAPLASTALEGARTRFIAVRGTDPAFSRRQAGATA